MATLATTNSEIYALVGMTLGIGRDSTAWDATTLADVNRVIRSGRRRFFGAHNWAFLEQHIQVLTAAPYATGTITVASGVVTLAGGTFPTNAAFSVLTTGDSTYDGLYEVSTRDSGTQVTLHDTNVTIGSATTFSLYQYRYALPSNFGGWLDPVVRENNNNMSVELNEYATLPEWIVRGIGNRTNLRTGDPELFAITQIADEETGIPAYYLDVYPLPDAVYVLKSRMQVVPGDSLAESTAVTHMVFTEVMIESILASAEVFLGAPGVHMQRFQELLPEAIRKDRQMRGTRTVRPRASNSPYTQPKNYELIVGTVTLDNDAVLP